MLAVKKSLTSNATIFRRSVRLMGDSFEISVVGENPVWADGHFDDAITEITRVEKLLSAFTDDGMINQVNRNAGEKPVKVSAEIFNLINRSLQIAELTHGTFDFTYAPADRADDEGEGQNTTTVYKAKCADYKNVILNSKAVTVYLREKDMRIGFGANSKGYAADRAKYILQMNGVSNGVINAGGDLLAWGLQPNKEPWTVATADPAQQSSPFANVEISNMAIATSTNAEKLATINNNKFEKVNQKNGFVVSGIKSVSIIGPSAEFADAMATPVMDMGINNGLYLINQLNQLGCIIVDDHNRLYTSKHIRITA